MCPMRHRELDSRLPPAAGSSPNLLDGPSQVSHCFDTGEVALLQGDGVMLLKCRKELNPIQRAQSKISIEVQVRRKFRLASS